MSKGLLFWIIFIVTVLVWAGWIFGPSADQRYFEIGFGPVEFILIGILGWKTFGAPVQ